MNNQICVLRDIECGYPTKDTLFRPSVSYPEYRFKELSAEENRVYEMVRQGFKMLGLDNDNYGTPDWNPLGEYVHENDIVLLKPNLVLDRNRNGLGEDCLYTHPSVVAAVIDYVCIALKDTGKIIVGDAPLQDCDFDKLIKESGYWDLIEYYLKKGIDIELKDLRNIKTKEESGYYYMQEKEGNDGIVVRLDSDSMFAGLSEEHNKNLRITNYDPRILQKHHSGGNHEYNISQYLLNADVLINIPKPKTHRKAGLTGALKNLVGINANKEYLPHHTLGSVSEGGDAYHHENKYYSMANQVLDLRNTLMKENKEEEAKQAFSLYESLKNLGSQSDDENYWEGSWYGNDTIWRTVVDLNRIAFYADKSGRLKDEIQRRYFSIADMIISGEKEGPLMPSPKETGVLVMGEDPLLIDQAVSSLMGFDYRKIPQLSNYDAYFGEYPISSTDKPNIISNEKNWNDKDLDEIRTDYSLCFQPTSGWEEALGNKHKQGFIEKLKAEKKDIVIWGCGVSGKYAYRQLSKNAVRIKCFCDNDVKKIGSEIIDGIQCIAPAEIKDGSCIIIAVTDKYVGEIQEVAAGLGHKVFGIINKDKWEYAS